MTEIMAVSDMTDYLIQSTLQQLYKSPTHHFREENKTIRNTVR